MRTILSLTAIVLLLSVPASAATVFSTDFESGTPAQIGGFGSTYTSGGMTGLGTTIWRNDAGVGQATTLTLTGLAPSSSLSLAFDFIAIDSWDGTTASCCTPDQFNVNLNGVNVLQASVFQNNCCSATSLDALTFSNGASGTFVKTFDDGTSHIANGGWRDTVWHATVNGLISDGLGNATFSFFASGAGWQAGIDESIGLDNIVVTATAVPVPGSLVLVLAAGLLSLGATAGRKLTR